MSQVSIKRKFYRDEEYKWQTIQMVNEEYKWQTVQMVNEEYNGKQYK